MRTALPLAQGLHEGRKVMTLISAYAFGVFGITALAALLLLGHGVRDCYRRSSQGHGWRGCLSHLLGTL